MPLFELLAELVAFPWNTIFYLKQWLALVYGGYFLDTLISLIFTLLTIFGFLGLFLWVGAAIWCHYLNTILFPPTPLCSYCQMYYIPICYRPNNTVMYIFFHMFPLEEICIYTVFYNYLITFPSVLCFFNVCVCVCVCVYFNFYLGLLNFNLKNLLYFFFF